MNNELLTKKEKEMQQEELFLADMGDRIAEILNIKKNKDGRFNTEFGTKTNIGLARTIKRLATAIDTKEKI
jgi:hypothetical protein